MRRFLLALPLVLFGCGDADTATAGTPKDKGATPAADPAAVQDPNEVVASWEGGQITWGALDERVGSELRTMEMQHLMSRYETQAQALEQLLVDALLETEAAAKGHADVRSLLEAEIEAKVAPPTDDEVTAFYPVVQRQLGGASLEEARPMLLAELTRRAQGDRYREYIGELTNRVKVERKLPYPDLPRVEVPVSDADPAQGPADAPVTIVQFAEYECYYCARVGPTLDQIVSEYGDKVRLVYKDYPLPNHSRAHPSAVAAHCAGEQGKYWEMNKLLLENQQALQDAHLRSYAGQVVPDASAWQECVDSGRFDALVSSGLEVGRKAGVSATPTFFVNGVLVSGAQPFERFKDLIDREIAQ